MKYKLIQDIYNQWIGGFITGNYAMSKIGEILDSREISVKLINTETDEVVFEGKSIL